MKFSCFADFHYYPGMFYGASVATLQQIQARAVAEKCDFIIHAGDLVHSPSTFNAFVDRYNSFEIPSYNCLGNHDTDKTPYTEVLKHYKMPDGHYYFDCKGYRILVCDPNYYLLDGAYIHYNLHEHRELRGMPVVPPDQLEWMETAIAEAPGPCVLISHQSFEREADGVVNQAEVRKILTDANARKPHSVLMCINGHYHRDNLRLLDGILYFDLNSTSYDWLDKRHDLYPDGDIKREYYYFTHTLVYDRPVHAIITLEGTRVKIDGMEGHFLYGVTREMTDNPPLDPAGRPATAVVSSADVTL